MRNVLLILMTLPTLVGCGQADGLVCEKVMQEVFACMDRVSSGRSEDLERCIPLREPEEIEGTWATDFEFNEFYENQRLTYDEAVRFTDDNTSLWLTDGVKDPHTSETTSVIWVRFIGRRPVCDASATEHDIWIDRVLEYEVIEERPSEWYQGS